MKNWVERRSAQRTAHIASCHLFLLCQTSCLLGVSMSRCVLIGHWLSYLIYVRIKEWTLYVFNKLFVEMMMKDYQNVIKFLKSTIYLCDFIEAKCDEFTNRLFRLLFSCSCSSSKWIRCRTNPTRASQEPHAASHCNKKTKPSNWKVFHRTLRWNIELFHTLY